MSFQCGAWWAKSLRQIIENFPGCTHYLAGAMHEYDISIVRPLTMPYAIINGMILKIDKAGRIVVPKPLRERMGLRAGVELEVEEVSGGLTLKPLSDGPSMIREDGFWVHQGVAPVGFDWNRHAAEERDARHRQVSGL
jgi:AbrB family looped-hinge helix DNA binding protein